MFCYKCGEKLPEKINFCHKCGSKVATLTDDIVPVADTSNEVIEKPVESLPQVTPSNDTPEADANNYQQQVSSVSAPTFVPEPVHASAHIPTTKTKSKKPVIIAGIITVIVLVIGAFIIFSNLGNGESSVETSSSLMHDNPYIQNVKNVHMFGRSDVLLGDAFNSFFDNPEWEVSSRATATVEFNGSFQFEGRVSSTHMLISSNPDIVGHVTLLMINGEIRNDVVGELLESIFEQYVGDGTASSRDFHDNPHIQEVINGHFRGFNDLEFPNITIGEALNAFFDNIGWELSDGSVTEYDVHFFGDMIYNGELVRVEIVFVPSIGSRIGDGEFVASLIQIGDTMSETSLTSRGHNFIEQIFGSQPASQPNIIDTTDWISISSGNLSIDAPSSFEIDIAREGRFFIEANDIRMFIAYFNRFDNYWEWLVYGDNIHTDQFGIATNRQDFVFNDGRQGFLVEYDEAIVFFDYHYFVRLFLEGDRTIYTENEDLILRIARSLTLEPAPATAQAPSDIDINIVGRWQLDYFVDTWGDGASDAFYNWFVGGETLELFADGTGVERLGASSWDFTWFIEQVWSYMGTGFYMDILRMDYGSFEMSFWFRVGDEYMAFFTDGPDYIAFSRIP